MYRSLQLFPSVGYPPPPTANRLTLLHQICLAIITSIFNDITIKSKWFISNYGLKWKSLQRGDVGSADPKQDRHQQIYWKWFLIRQCYIVFYYWICDMYVKYFENSFWKIYVYYELRMPWAVYFILLCSCTSTYPQSSGMKEKLLMSTSSLDPDSTHIWFNA